MLSFTHIGGFFKMAKFIRSALVVLIIFLMVGLTSDPTKIAGVKFKLLLLRLKGTGQLWI